jgi:glycine/D-amino acid oxidase-like deaminating enzyme
VGADSVDSCYTATLNDHATRPVLDEGVRADVVIVVGGSNYSGRQPADSAAELRPSIERMFPRLKDIEIECTWSGSAGITINRIPQVGRLSPNVYYAQGCSGHGTATSHVVGEIMAEAISGSLTRGSMYSPAFVTYACRWENGPVASCWHSA